MKRKINLAKVASFVMLLTVTAMILVAGTYAKYSSQASGTDATVVAKWSFKVNGTEIAIKDSEPTVTFDLFNTINDTATGEKETDVADGLIAPGTTGAFEFVLLNSSEVTTKYAINLEIKEGENVPLEFSLDGGNSWTKITELSDLVATDVMAIGSTKNVTVQWKWTFNGDTDAALGGQKVEVSANITATQVDNGNIVLENKTALFIGDSVQYGSKNDGKAWSYYIEQEYSMGDVNNVAVGSTSFTQNSRTPSRIIEQYKNLTGTYDYVIIEGGINDLTYGSEWGTLSDEFKIVKNSEVIVEAMEEAFYTALTKFPDAKIGYILLYNTEDSGRSGHDTLLDDYHDLIVSICEKWNIPVLDMYSGSVLYEGQTVTFDELLDVHNKTYLVDGLHLNEAGYLKTYKYIAEWMKTLTTVSAPTIEGEEVPTVEKVTLGSNTYTVANSIADLEWTTGYKVGTGMNYVSADQEGRLASKGYVLKVSGGETISISDGENYNFALYEVDANNNPSGERCENWVTNSVILNSSTKYVGFYLKKVDETAWTTDEINNIENILTIE